jgi:predicted DsbA family dithiol-disulfide isomerase
MRTRVKTTVAIAAIVCLCLAGAWASGQLVKLHADGQTADGVAARLCRATAAAGFDCAAAIESKWSRVLLPVPVPGGDDLIDVDPVPVPVAFFGLGYFVFIGVWFGLAGTINGPWRRVPLHVGVCGLIMSALYIGLMASGAAGWCIWCLAVHVINAGMVALVWWVTRGAGQGLRGTNFARFLLSPPREVVAATAVAALLIGGLWIFRHEKLQQRAERDYLLTYKTLVGDLRTDPAFLVREYLAQQWHDVPLRASERVADDAMALTVFTDFECPACFCHATGFEQNVQTAFEGRIEVLVRHFPLCASCNEHTDRTLHPESCRAARAAEAARILGGEGAFAAMRAQLLEHHDRLEAGLYPQLAERIGLDPEAFVRTMQGDEVRRIVADDIALAHRIGVTGTPAMVLDGRLVPEICKSDAFWYAIAEARTAQPVLTSDLEVPAW